MKTLAKEIKASSSPALKLSDTLTWALVLDTANEGSYT